MYQKSILRRLCIWIILKVLCRWSRWICVELFRRAGRTSTSIDQSGLRRLKKVYPTVWCAHHQLVRAVSEYFALWLYCHDRLSVEAEVWKGALGRDMAVGSYPTDWCLSPPVSQGSTIYKLVLPSWLYCHGRVVTGGPSPMHASPPDTQKRTGTQA